MTPAMHIASGILLAATVMFMAKHTVDLWRRGDPNMSVLIGAATAIFYGSLVLTGLGYFSP